MLKPEEFDLSESRCLEKDEDYKGLVGMTLRKSVQKRTGIRDPFQRISHNFKIHYRSGIGWPKVRKETIRARGGRCEDCGSTEGLEVHHKVNPRINEDENLEVLCKHCHGKKHPYLNRG
ncbi:MAG: HNH endonuclease [Firmicutes bacterium]|nr:HNH endonuclease [Bacillota bacterium]